VPTRPDRPRGGRSLLRCGSLLVGVDFSSTPTPRKPITAAIGRWHDADPLPEYRLDEVVPLASLAGFEAFLRTAGPWIGGFDLPFGQPRDLIEHEGWPTEWEACVRHYCSLPRPLLREAFRSWCAARPPGDKFAWRAADRPAGSSPAMRWTNPPVAWMMHAGIGRMLDAGLAFPAHRHPGGRRLPPDGRVALEAYPGFTARQVCRTSYKSDLAAGQTADRRGNRRAIVAALVAGRAGLDLRLTIDTAWRRRLIADGRGDLLDAVICAMQAGHAAALDDYGLPPKLDPLEGWIAAVPGGGAGGAHGRAPGRRVRLPRLKEPRHVRQGQGRPLTRKKLR
jgi:hypothetical protein